MKMIQTTFGQLAVGDEFTTDDGEFGFIKMEPLSYHKPGEGWASVIGTRGSGDFKDDEPVMIWVDELAPMAVDARAIQHTLAESYRANTGTIPRGQLWQPCEKRGCNNEPVCMNCMLCESEHCHCFDGE